MNQASKIQAQFYEELREEKDEEISKLLTEIDELKF